MDTRDLAREALYGFFRRCGEAGKFYCAPCLVERLRRTFPLAAVQAAVADAFERPGRCAGSPADRVRPARSGDAASASRGQDSRTGSGIAMTVSLVVSLLIAVIGGVLWVEGGPHPRTWAAWLLLGAILIVSALPALFYRLFC